jgi:hypothetical protein
MSTDVRQGVTADGIGQVTLDGVRFANVEWSEKKQRWCVEDSEGQCLKHVGSIKGMAASKDEAAALAINMVRDGRMPDPETARAEHRERLRVAREKRLQQPAEIRRRERDRRYSDALRDAWRAESEEDEAPPLYETLAEAFDFSDPELWKSNSFTALRPRLALHVRAVIAKLEEDLAWEIGRSPKPFVFDATKEQRQAAAALRNQRTAFWRSCRPPTPKRQPAVRGSRSQECVHLATA